MPFCAYCASLHDSLQPLLIWRLVLNLKLAAHQEIHYSIGTISSLHAVTPGDAPQRSMSASIRELGGPLLLPGEDVDQDLFNEPA